MSCCFKMGNKANIRERHNLDKYKSAFLQLPQILPIHHIQGISLSEKKPAQDVVIQAVYQQLLENRDMRSFFDPHLLNSKKPRHISSFMPLISSQICKRFCSRQQPPWSSYFTHLSHFRNLDSATQVYYKDFSPFFSYSLNMSTSILNYALHKVPLSLTLM